MCKYPGCDKRFRARNALAYHHKAIHESGDILLCTEEGCKFTTRKPEALATHKLRHQQRDAAKAWKAQKKTEVQAAVKSAKEETKEKSEAGSPSRYDSWRRNSARTRGEERTRGAQGETRAREAKKPPPQSRNCTNSSPPTVPNARASPREA